MWSLHNEVRNARKVKLTGFGAINELNNYLLLFFIERNFDKYGIDDECKFSYLYENFCSPDKLKEDEKNKKYSIDTKTINKLNYWKLWHHWCDVSNMNSVLR